MTTETTPVVTASSVPTKVGSTRGAMAHRAAVDRLVASYRAIPRESGVRLAKRTSNLFRPRAAAAGPGLDVGGLTGVVSLDADAATADVQGMCTYEDLVAVTLPKGFMPYVVPQLRTITLGGAVTGLGIESSSFRNGLPHESVLELDVLTGAGDVVTALEDRGITAFLAPDVETLVSRVGRYLVDQDFLDSAARIDVRAVEPPRPERLEADEIWTHDDTVLADSADRRNRGQPRAPVGARQQEETH
jgi:hypothetical protein